MSGKINLTIGNRTWDVDVQLTADELRTGLLTRTSLDPGKGMLFPFDTPQVLGVTTVGMQFTIDVVFIGPDQHVLAIEDALAPGNVIQSPAPASAFFELAAHDASAINVGDEVSYVDPQQVFTPAFTGSVRSSQASVLEQSSILNQVVPLMTQVLVIGFAVSLVAGLMVDEKRPAQLYQRVKQSAESDVLNKLSSGARRLSVEDRDAAESLIRKGQAVMTGADTIAITDAGARRLAAINAEKNEFPGQSQEGLSILHIAKGMKGFVQDQGWTSAHIIFPDAARLQEFVEEMRRQYPEHTIFPGREQRDLWITLNVERLYGQMAEREGRGWHCGCMYQKVPMITPLNMGTLTPAQLENLEGMNYMLELMARDTAYNYAPLSGVEVMPAEFNDENIAGATNGTFIYIAPWRLDTREQSMNTLAHELAHVMSRENHEGANYREDLANVSNFLMANDVSPDAFEPPIEATMFYQLAPEVEAPMIQKYGRWAVRLAETLSPPGDSAMVERMAASLSGRIRDRVAATAAATPVTVPPPPPQPSTATRSRTPRSRSR